MKYIIHKIPVNGNFVCWSESELQYREDGAGMANGMKVDKLFSTEELAVSHARRQLIAAGVKEEDILIQ